VRFWDSSALVPLLVQQPSSKRADSWFAEDSRPAVWTLSIVEITSALWRLVRERHLDEDIASVAETRMRELVAASHVVVDVESSKAIAQRLLRMHGLRAGDALQLAAALVWAAGRPQGKTLLTLDERLAVAARREGFDVPAAS
jgi:predicted nucleic acid-binding protein